MRLLGLAFNGRRRPGALLWLGLSVVLAVPIPTAGAAHASPSAGALPAGCHPPGCPDAGPASTVPSSDGFSWVHLRHANVTLPPARTGASLVSDPADDGVLLFGGCGPSACPLSDTWWYSRGLWTNLTPNLTAQPAGRFGAAAAYDPSGGQVILLGGCSASGPLSDSWSFHLGAWTEVAVSAVHPAARCGASASSDPSANGAAFYGGVASDGSALADLWLFRNGSFVQLSAGGTGAPSPRSGAALTYDPSQGWLFLLGGRSASGKFLGDAWAYSGGLWLSVPVGSTGSPAPVARSNATFAYDPTLSGDLLFGGASSSGILGDTWLYQAGAWTNVSATISRPPAPHQGAASTYDDTDGYLLLEGGRTPGNTIRNDTWALVRPLTASIILPYGSIQPGELVRLAPSVTGGVPPYHYNWSFGDGTPSLHLPTPTHSFASAGNFTIRLVVLDLRNVLTWSNLTVSVASSPLRVVLAITPSVVTVGGSASITASVTGGIPPYTIHWTGLPRSCPAVATTGLTCRPDTPGSFAIGFEVTDSAGTRSSAGAPLSVSAVATGVTSSATAGALATFDRFGWLLVPPLAAALVWAGYTSLMAYRGVRNLPPFPSPAPRPECYVPPEWSETPPAFESGGAAPGNASASPRR